MKSSIEFEYRAWGHLTISASFALTVLYHLEKGDLDSAQSELDFIRKNLGKDKYAGIALEALNKLIGVGVLEDLYDGGLVPQMQDELATKILELRQLENTHPPGR